MDGLAPILHFILLLGAAALTLLGSKNTQMFGNEYGLAQAQLAQRLFEGISIYISDAIFIPFLKITNSSNFADKWC